LDFEKTKRSKGEDMEKYDFISHVKVQGKAFCLMLYARYWERTNLMLN